MGRDSKIEWTTHTFNAWRGCTHHGPECLHCYAAAMSLRNPKTLGVWGPNGTRVVASEAMWKEPVKRNAEAGRSVLVSAEFPNGRVLNRPRVFCASLADVFEDWTGLMAASDGAAMYVCGECGAWRTIEQMCCGPNAHEPLTLNDVRGRLFRLIDATPNLDWLLLTKRPERIQHCVPWSYWVGGKGSPNTEHRSEPWPNCWLGTSVGHRSTLHRIDTLRTIPAAVRFLSIEPLLENLGTLDLTGIHWVIVGGESGHGARPMHPDWARSLRDQCQAAGVAFFFKQWGEFGPSPDAGLPDDLPDSAGFYFDPPHPPHKVWRFGKKTAGRTLDGREWNEFPHALSESARRRAGDNGRE